MIFKLIIFLTLIKLVNGFEMDTILEMKELIDSNSTKYNKTEIISYYIYKEIVCDTNSTHYNKYDCIFLKMDNIKNMTDYTIKRYNSYCNDSSEFYNESECKMYNILYGYKRRQENLGQVLRILQASVMIFIASIFMIYIYFPFYIAKFSFFLMINLNFYKGNFMQEEYIYNIITSNPVYLGFYYSYMITFTFIYFIIIYSLTKKLCFCK